MGYSTQARKNAGIARSVKTLLGDAAYQSYKRTGTYDKSKLEAARAKRTKSPSTGGRKTLSKQGVSTVVSQEFLKLNEFRRRRAEGSLDKFYSPTEVGELQVLDEKRRVVAAAKFAAEKQKLIDGPPEAVPGKKWDFYTLEDPPGMFRNAGRLTQRAADYGQVFATRAAAEREANTCP